jgi:hypothetical protein
MCTTFLYIYIINSMLLHYSHMPHSSNLNARNTPNCVESKAGFQYPMALIAALISAKDTTSNVPKRNEHLDMGALCSVNTLHATQKAGRRRKKKCLCRANTHQQHNRLFRRRSSVRGMQILSKNACLCKYQC